GMSDLAKRIANLPPEKREKLLRRLEEEAKAKAAQRTPEPEAARDRSQPMPLSFAQHRLWFIDRMQPGLAVYNLPALFQVEGELDVGAFAWSLEALVARHEVLRTTFAEEKGQPVQVVTPSLKVELPVKDLRGLPEQELAAEAERLAREEMLRPFELARGPLMRAALLRLGEREHLVVLTLHHIVFDIWSMGVLLRDLTELYAARLAGREPRLPPLPMQYGDYARWQRESLRGQVLEQQLSYWRKQLEGLTMLELPVDRPRPAVPSFRGAAHVFVIPRSRVESLQKLAQRQGCSLFMVLLAALKVVLARNSGQTDVAVGIPIAGRSRRELEGLIGFFINTLVMRTELSGDPSFLEVLRRVRETSLGAYAHQELPLEHLAAELQPERDPGQTPFYRVSFNLQNAPLGAIDVPGLTLRPRKAAVGMAKLDLSLHLTEGAEGLSCVWEYSTDLFEAGTVERMAGHYERVLEQVVEEPERRVGELELMGREERERVLREWNRTEEEWEGRACAHELFEARAEKTPEAEAVSCEGVTLTYGEVERRANKLAWHLRGLGVGPEVRVGLCVERTVEMVVGMLGILKAGGAYVPLDPTYPAERLGVMMEEAALPVLVTQGELADELPSRGEQVVYLDEDWEGVERQPEGRVEAGVGPENLAYAIFTSGSTGRPKGVMVRHRGLVNTARAAGKAHGVKEESRVLQFASMSFDASVCEVFSTLGAGACLCLAKREKTLPGAPLARTLVEERVTHVTLTPSVLALQGVEGLEGVGTVISAGEACTREVVARWKPGRRMLNAYGPTEVTVCAT
ncbi:MAG TPA: condensation domain-containing protein, partial [Myxococcaceae bacterium]|nr:condensation domain-containing protein [Myxococcaceae bacterium]